MDLRGRLLSQSSILFGARIAGAGLVVGVQAAIARIWGSQILGEYLLIIAGVNLLAMVMPLGFNTVGTYFAAEYRAREQGQLLWQFLLRAYAHVLFAGAGLGLVFLVVSIVWAGQLPEIANYWMPATVLAAAVAFVFINGAVLVGLKRPYAGFFADGLVRPMLVIAAFVFATAISGGAGRLNMMLWAFALGYALVALAHLGLVMQTVRNLPVNADPAEGQSNRWWRFAAPWVLIALASGFFFDIDLILLSALLDKETLAVFGVSTRIFSLLTFGVSAVYVVSLPDMFEAVARSEDAEFHRRIGDANLVAAALSVILSVGVLLGGPLILWVFGPGFVAGTVPLAILSLVLVVRSVFGPGELVLSIQDRPWASLPAIGLGLGVLVAGNMALVPLFGLTGAALAALLAFSVWSLTLWWIVLGTTGLNVSIFPRLLALGTRSRAC